MDYSDKSHVINIVFLVNKDVYWILLFYVYKDYSAEWYWINILSVLVWKSSPFMYIGDIHFKVKYQVSFQHVYSIYIYIYILNNKKKRHFFSLSIDMYRFNISYLVSAHQSTSLKLVHIHSSCAIPGLQ